YIEDASVWMNSPLLEQEDRSGPMLSMSPPMDNDHYGMVLNVIVHEASKQGLVVWLDDLSLGFLPDRRIAAYNSEDDELEDWRSIFDAPDLPSSAQMAQQSKRAGKLSLKEATHRIKAWLQPHLPTLGFNLSKENGDRDFRRLNYQRLIEGGLQRLYITVSNEKQHGGIHVLFFSFSTGFEEINAIVRAGREDRKLGENWTVYLEDFFTAADQDILKQAGIEKLTWPLLNTERDWHLFETYYLKQFFTRYVSWFDQVRTLEDVYQHYWRSLDEKHHHKTSTSSLVCLYLVGAPEYETYLIKDFLVRSNYPPDLYNLRAHLDTHVTPHTGVKPEYRIAAPIDDPIPTLAPPVLPVLTEERYGLHLVVLPAGSFDMGSDRDEEGPIHQVHVPSFALGMYPVTQQQWEAVMGHNPSFFKGVNCPVESITWFDAQAFIVKLNEQTGQTYRLPSEAEWEYACKAGTTGKWYFGEDEALLQDHAWYADNSDLRTHPVGQKQPNPFGLYDMLGNVGEWCQDVGMEHYRDAPTDGSAQASPPSGDTKKRIVRGGSWCQGATDLSSTKRGKEYTNVNGRSYRNINLGLRLAMTLK
ncbi:MAG: hypothetical protein RLZZ612_67, partial [Pseudomonadota bacterium]